MSLALLNWFLCCFLIPIGSCRHDSKIVRRTCLDHFFAGQDKSGIFSVNYDDVKNPRQVYCDMSMSSEGRVETVVQNALQFTSWDRGFLLNKTKSMEVSYQLTKQQLQCLRNVSTSCSQTLYFQCGPSSESRNLPVFTNIFGEHFLLDNAERLCDSNPNINIELETQKTGVNRFGPSNSSIKMSLGSLKCTKSLNTSTCFFYLVPYSALTLSDLTGFLDIRFSFRIQNQKYHRLLTLSLQNGKRIEISVKDGFFLVFDREQFPTQLLADLEWHKISIIQNSNGFHVQIDNNQPYEIQYQLSLPVKTAVIGYVAGDPSSEPMDVCAVYLNNKIPVICNGSNLIRVSQILPTTSALRKKSASRSCFLPGSVGNCLLFQKEYLSRGRLVEQSVITVPRVDLNNPFEKGIGLQFRTYQKTALLLFAASSEPNKFFVVYLRDKNLVFQYCNRAESSKEEINRANSCLKCHLSSSEFNSNRWITVSVLVNDKGIFHMTANKQICAAINASSELKGISLPDLNTSVVYIGSNPNHDPKYPEKFGALNQVTGDLFHGCINRNVVIGSNPVRLKSQSASVSEKCPPCQCKSIDAVCRSDDAGNHCDCSNSLQFSNGQQCISTGSVVSLFSKSGDSITLPGDRLESTSGREKLRKLWIEFSLPHSSESGESCFVRIISSATDLRELSICTEGKSIVVHFQDAKGKESLHFPIDFRDRRLHIFLMEYTEIISRSFPLDDLYKYKVQVDGYHREIELTTADRLSKIGEIQINRNPSFYGCISNFGLQFTQKFWETANLTEINVLELLGQQYPGLLNEGQCGITDLAVLSGVVASKYGSITEYNGKNSESGSNSKDSAPQNAFPWLIIAVAVGGIVILLVILAFIFLAIRSKRNKRKETGKRSRTPPHADTLTPSSLLPDTNKEKSKLDDSGANNDNFEERNLYWKPDVRRSDSKTSGPYSHIPLIEENETGKPAPINRLSEMMEYDDAVSDS